MKYSHITVSSSEQIEEGQNFSIALPKMIRPLLLYL